MTAGVPGATQDITPADSNGKHAASSFPARFMHTAGSLAGVLQGSFEFAGYLMSTVRAPKQLWVGHGMRTNPTLREPGTTAKALLQLAGTTRLLDLSKLSGTLDLQQMLREFARGTIRLDSYELDDMSSDAEDDYDDYDD